ncbi:MAG: antibiotic biosynthesis monooxygenase [Dehalococcoidia bacterium]
MFGSMARMYALPGRRDEVVETYERHFRDLEHVPGLIAFYLYRLDEDPDGLGLSVVFDSRSSYVANSTSPAQNARYAEVRALLREDPVWADGDVETFMRF